MVNSEDQFADIWTTAIAKYQQTTKIKLQDLELFKLKTITDLEHRIDQNNGKIKEFRGKRGDLFKVLRNALLPVEALGNIAGGAINIGCPPSSLVFGAVSCLISAADDVSSNYDAIQDLIEQLGNFTVRLQIYSQEHVSSSLKIKLTEVLVTLLNIFALARKLIKHGRILEFGRSLVLGRDPQIKDSLNTLEALTRAENLLVGAETHLHVSRQGRKIDEIADTVRESQTEFLRGNLRSKEMHEELVMLIERSGYRDDTNIKTVLDPRPFAEVTYKRLLKAKTPGTGDWMFKEKPFRNWMDKAFPVIFVSGIPGAGKSFLSTNIISYFLEQYPQGSQDSSRVSVSYFYFQDKDPDTRSVHQALRDMAFQIHSNDAIYAKSINLNCQSHEEIKTIETAWQKLFVDFFVESKGLESTALLILDGIDEASSEDLNIFLPLLQDLEPDVSGALRLQIMLVGRPHLSDHIANAMDSDTVPTVSVDAGKNSDDIANYIQSSIKKSRTLRKASKELQILVVNTLTERANGMFLWVDLMLRQLNSLSREAAIRAALDNAPKGLQDMISHVLQVISASLSSEDADDLNILLAWVTCAKTPLSLGDLDGIIKYKSPNGEGLIDLESLLRNKYASFFLLTREDGLSTTDLMNMNQRVTADQTEADDEPGLDYIKTSFESNHRTTYVTFCHASIGDFFRDTAQGQVRSDSGPLVGVNIVSANMEILETIFELYINDKLVEFRDRYCNWHWQAHMKEASVSKASSDSKKKLGPLIAKFCRDESILRKWCGSAGEFFGTGTYIATLREWLDDKEILNFLQSGDRDWILSTADRPAAAFEGLARLYAKEWLQKTDWNAHSLCWCLFGYIQCKDNKTLRPFNQGFESALTIEEVANWAGFEKNALWHGRVGVALRESNFLDEAQNHFENALQLDPTLWGIQAGLSLISKARNDFQKAICYTDQEIATIEAHSDQHPESKDSWAASNLQARGEHYKKIGNDRMAFESFRDACITYPLNYPCFEACLKYLDSRDNPREVMKLARLIFEDVRSNEHYPFIVKYCKHKLNDPDTLPFYILRRSASETGKLSYLTDKYREGIEVCRRNRYNASELNLEVYLADIYYHEKIDIEQALRLWEHIGQRSADSSSGSISWTVYLSLRMRAKHYFARARECRGIESAQYVSKLAAMAKSRERKGASYNLNEASMILGAWYCLTGQMEESRACFEGHVKQALQLLSDGDPKNDQRAYIDLSMALLMAGDEENFMALMQKTFSKTGAGEPENNGPDEGGLFVRCDGVCPPSRPIVRKNSFWFCRYCHDTGFCEPCLAKLKADKLPLNICNASHSWIELKLTDKIIPPDQMLVGDNFVSVEQWKTDLQKVWTYN